MKSSKLSIAVLTVFAFLSFAAFDANAQFGGMIDKAKDKTNKAKDDAKKKADEEAKKADEKTNSGAGGATKKTNTPAKQPVKPATGETNAKGGDNDDARRANAENLAKTAGMPKAANTDAALNKLLFQAADDHRLVPRRVVITDKDYMFTTDARGNKVRRIFAVVAQTLDGGKCGKLMVQFDQDWREGKWGAVYVQNIGAVTPIACGAIGK